MKRKPANGSLGTAKTLRAAISRTGLPERILQQLKDAGSIHFKANGTIDCDGVMDQAAELPEVQISDDELPDYRLELALDKRASRKLKEQTYRQRDKLAWPIELIRRGWFRNVITAKKKLYAAEHEISAECALRGFSADQAGLVRELVAKHHRAAVKELFHGEWGKVICPSCSGEVAA